MRLELGQEALWFLSEGLDFREGRCGRGPVNSSNTSLPGCSDMRRRNLVSVNSSLFLCFRGFSLLFRLLGKTSWKNALPCKLKGRGIFFNCGTLTNRLRPGSEMDVSGPDSARPHSLPGAPGKLVIKDTKTEERKR